MSMDEEDLPRRPKPGPKPLEAMSVEELRRYIEELEAEIARARDMIAEKEKVRSGAEALFRK